MFFLSHLIYSFSVIYGNTQSLFYELFLWTHSKSETRVKKYYAEYKTKGVQFLSVSIDAKKDDWTKALKEEQMLWMQGWTPDSGKSVLKTYQFNGIPFIILIDKEGKIYRKYLRGEQIKKAIDDCLIGKRFDEK